MINATVGQISSALSTVLGTPVVADAPPATTPCNATLNADKQDLLALGAALKQECGLQLAPGRRDVERLELIAIVSVPAQTK